MVFLHIKRIVLLGELFLKKIMNISHGYIRLLVYNEISFGRESAMKFTHDVISYLYRIYFIHVLP